MDPAPAPPRTNLEKSSRLPWVVALAIAAALLGGGAWWFLRGGEPPPPPVAAAPPESPAPTPAPDAVAADAVAPERPPLDADSARAALEGASTSPLFRSWLGGDLARRWVTITANLAEGESPRTPLKSLAPAAHFSTVQRGDRLAIAPESYARYDAFADAVGSIDAGTVASVYRRLHPVLEAAWRAMGLSARPLDAATAKALRRIAGARVVDGEVIVLPGDGGYVFADPDLEKLGEVDKHLLRMGPRNERILAAKARAILEALQLPVVTAHRP
jgi:hypothetical protein